MAYFSNGCEGESYYYHYCARCVNDDAENERYCPIWNWHLMDNYQECNKPDSYLHKLIPRSKDGYGNEQCVMFLEKEKVSEVELPPRSTAADILSEEQLRQYVKSAK